MSNGTVVKDSCARLGERLFGDYAHQLRLVVQMRKEPIEFGLNTLAHAAEHQRNHGWQGQLALAGEGAGTIGVGRVQEKFGRAYARGKIDKKREREGACWPMNKKIIGANNLFLICQVFFVFILKINGFDP